MKKYGAIIIDPPWQYSNSGISGAAENHYPPMTNEELIQLPVEPLAADDALLLMWVTWPKLFENPGPREMIEAWGFRYKTGMPWVKLNGVPSTDLWGNIVMRPYPGQGWWVRGATEAILICTRGKIKYPDDPPIGLVSDRFEHSRKPTNVHEYAELFPGPYLEMFARRPYSDDWDLWGNEVDSDITLEVNDEGAD